MNKKIILGLTAIFFMGVFAGAFVAVIAQSSQIFTIGDGIFPGTPSFTFFANGDQYSVKDQYGITTSGADPAVLINGCVSPGVSIKLLSSFSIGSTLVFDADNCTLFSDGNVLISLEDSSNVNMINVTGNFCIFRDFMLFGNRANNEGNVSGIYQYFAYCNKYYDLDIRGCSGDGIFIDGDGNSGNNHIERCKIVEHDRYAVQLWSEVDTWVVNNDLGAVRGHVISGYFGVCKITGNAIYMGGWTGTGYEGTLWGTGIHCYGGNNNIISDNAIRGCAGHGIDIEEAFNNTVTGNSISFNDQELAGYAGIKVSGYSNFTLLSGNMVGNYEQNQANFTQSYGFWIGGTSRYTVLVGNMANWNLAADFWIDNATSTCWIASCLNGTDWIH